MRHSDTSTSGKRHNQDLVSRVGFGVCTLVSVLKRCPQYFVDRLQLVDGYVVIGHLLPANPMHMTGCH